MEGTAKFAARDTGDPSDVARTTSGANPGRHEAPPGRGLQPRARQL